MKRITIICGHYGSGKSEISVNLALKYHIQYLVDLDIINPYFRSRSLFEMLEQNHIHLVESTVKNMTGSDMPYVSGEGVVPFVNSGITAIYDLGGTENGARVLVQFADRIKDINEIDMLCTVNIYRPETCDAKSIIKTIAMYEAETQIRVTGLINNTNLINETTEDDLINGEKVLLEVSKILNIPIKYTVIEESKTNFNYEFQGERIILNRLIAKKFL